jgi:hypothetical protein
MPMNPRLLRPRASGFDPRSISGLFQWFDGSDRATLFDATTGGSAVADNGTVARWEDKSGNARHLTQGTAGNRPTLRPAIRNGRSVLEYDGANSNLVSASITNDLSSLSIFAVFAQDTLGQNNLGTIWGNASLPGSGNRTYRIQAGPAMSALFGTNDGRLINLSSATGAFTRVHAFWNGGNNRASDFSFLEDGTARSSLTFGTITVTAASASATAVGNKPLGSNAWDGYIAEVLVYTRFLSVSERTRVDNWLKAKWGF